jgi:transcriptional regulator with XRE-family HTH domain
MKPSAFAVWLREKVASGSQSDAARALHVNKAALSRWLSGEGYPSRTSVARIAEHYGVPRAEIEAMLPDPREAQNHWTFRALRGEPRLRDRRLCAAVMLDLLMQHARPSELLPMLEDLAAELRAAERAAGQGGGLQGNGMASAGVRVA